MPHGFPNITSLFGRISLRAVVGLICVSIALGPGLRMLLPTGNLAAAMLSAPVELPELPTEEAPTQQETNSDSSTTTELPEEVGGAAIPGEKKCRRLRCRCKPSMGFLASPRTQRALQVHSGSLIVFEHQYRNGCGAHLRC